MCLLAICMLSLDKCLFRFSAHYLIFFYVMLYELLYVDILEIKPLLVPSFANISSYCVGCLFILSMVSFAVQKLLSLIRSHLFTFVFIFVTLACGSEKILLWCISESVLPKRCIVSAFIFRILFHFEFILCMVLECVLISFFYV